MRGADNESSRKLCSLPHIVGRLFPFQIIKDPGQLQPVRRRGNAENQTVSGVKRLVDAVGRKPVLTDGDQLFAVPPEAWKAAKSCVPRKRRAAERIFSSSIGTGICVVKLRRIALAWRLLYMR